MNERIKTTISTSNNIFDVNGQWLPKGNYYFCINNFTNTTAKGELFERTFKADYEFELTDLVKMMSVAQARLARRANISDINMPTSRSPTMSPVSRPPGLSFNRIRNYVDRNRSEESDEGKNDSCMCTICLELVDDNEKEVLHCNHGFHKICIDRWLSTNTNCPVCRSFVRPRNNRLPVLSNPNPRIPVTYEPIRRNRRNRRSNVRITPVISRNNPVVRPRSPIRMENNRRPISRSRRREYDMIYSSGNHILR